MGRKPDFCVERRIGTGQTGAPTMTSVDEGQVFSLKDSLFISKYSWYGREATLPPKPD